MSRHRIASACGRVSRVRSATAKCRCGPPNFAAFCSMTGRTMSTPSYSSSPDRATCCIQFQSPQGASSRDLALSLDNTSGSHSRTFPVARSSDAVPEPDSRLPQAVDSYTWVKTSCRDVRRNRNSCAFSSFSSGRLNRAATPQRIRSKSCRSDDLGKATPPGCVLAFVRQANHRRLHGHNPRLSALRGMPHCSSRRHLPHVRATPASPVSRLPTGPRPGAWPRAGPTSPARSAARRRRSRRAPATASSRAGTGFPW